jgi:hypothetical protein
VTGGELVERLEAAAFDADSETGALLLAAAAELRAVRSALVGHRGARDWAGNKIDQDLRLWEFVADVPWGSTVRGDG